MSWGGGSLEEQPAALWNGIALVHRALVGFLEGVDKGILE
jgi:hypothetical protein